MKIKLNLSKAQHTLKQKAIDLHGTILLVDDELENLDGLSALLSREYKVYATTQPKEAIELTKQHQIDVVISDQRMPEMLGTELLAHLREISPNQVRMLLTGYADIQDLIGCVNQGLLYRYLVKPWIPEDLMNTVHQAFEKLNIERQIQEQAQALKQEVNERREAQKQLEHALHELKETQNTLLAQAKLKALGEMVSGVAHDFNNLLTPIHAYCEELLIDLSSEKVVFSPPLEQAETLDSLYCIRNAATDGKSLIERLRASYAPKRFQNSDPPVFTVLFVSNLVREAVALALPRWYFNGANQSERMMATLSLEEDISSLDVPDSNIETWSTQLGQLTVRCHLHSKVILYGEKSELRQALVNLISNALDALKSQHSPCLEVNTHSQQDTMMFEIKDNGIGMNAEVLQHCRKQFFSTKGEEGTGLGLHMVRLSAEKHGGTLELHSQEGVGTSAELIIPLRPQNF